MDINQSLSALTENDPKWGDDRGTFTDPKVKALNNSIEWCDEYNVL